MKQDADEDKKVLLTAYRTLSIRHKIIILITSVAAIVTVCSMAASFFVELSFFKARLLEEYKATARMIASNLEASVDFQDSIDATETLAALSQKHFVVSACVYLQDGQFLASYLRDDLDEETKNLPAANMTSGLNDGSLIVNEPISVDGKILGRVVIKANLGEMSTFVSGRVWISLVLIIGSLAIAILLASKLGAHVARPIVELAKTTRRITEEHDVSTRQERLSDDETGQLVDAFNEMMGVIENREEALINAKEAAEASSRAKDDFLSVISHELRTPLNPIIGYVEILLRKSTIEEDSKQLGLVKQYSEHLQDLIDRIIDFSRFERGEVKLIEEPVDYQRLCQNVVTLLEKEADKKGILITYTHHSDFDSEHVSPNILSDRVKLQQTVLNLVSNAIKFTAEGKIEIRTSLSKNRFEKTKLRIEFEDTGIGISESDYDTVFKPFSQIDVSLKRQYSGMGLGLAITKRIVEAMDGSIDFTSTPGKGSIFWIEFPARFTAETDPNPSDSNTIQIAQPQSKRRVLLVDDQLVNLELGESMLNSCGQEVVCAESGEQAIQLAQKEEFSLIILDIKMPKMDGYETATKLRELKNGSFGTPIIGMTAHVTSDGDSLSRGAGMNDLLPKPFNTERLNQIIAKWLGGEA